MRDAERVFEQAAVGVAQVELVVDLVAPVDRRRTFEVRGERATVALQRHVGAEQIADRRRDVDVLGERVHRLAA